MEMATLAGLSAVLMAGRDSTNFRAPERPRSALPEPGLPAPLSGGLRFADGVAVQEEGRDRRGLPAIVDGHEDDEGVDARPALPRPRVLPLHDDLDLQRRPERGRHLRP